MDAVSCLPSSRDDACATHFGMSFLGLPGKALMQSPFAHLSEALCGITPDVLLPGIDGEHESKARKPHMGGLGFGHHSKQRSTVGGRDSNRLRIKDVSFENHCDSSLALVNLSGMQAQPDSRPGQVLEHARINTAENCVMYCTPGSPEVAISTFARTISTGFSGSTEMERNAISGFSNQPEKFWEYGFSAQPMPNMISRRKALERKSTQSSRQHVFTAHVSQPSAACKLTLKRLPLRAPLLQGKVPTEKTMDGKRGTRERKTRTDTATDKGRRRQSVQVLKQLLCGGVAGVISRSVVAPLDLIKTYLITSHGLGGSQKSALSVFKEIVDTSGWQGLFRGNVVNCVRVAPSKAIELCVFEVMRKELGKEGHPLKNAAATIAGGAAGMAGTVATYPLELIRTRLSVQPLLYEGILQATTKIFQEEGFMALYSGLSPSLVGIFPYAATNYFVYDGLRTTYRVSTGQQNVPTIPTLAFGAIAAAVSSTVTYPLEVARRQMQLSLTNTVRKSSVGIILDIYRHEGFLALYRGLGTTWLKLIPAAGISFVCYEAARFALRIDDASVAAKAKQPCNSADKDSRT